MSVDRYSSDETVGRRLRQLRGARGLTQTALAARSGLSISFVSRLEAGKRRLLRRSDLYALADALQVPPSELSRRAESGDDPVRHESIAAAIELRRALIAPAGNVVPRSMAVVAGELETVVRDRASADLAAMMTRLPRLLDECRGGVIHAVDEQERQAWWAHMALADHMVTVLAKALALPDIALLASWQQQTAVEHLADPACAVAERIQRAILWTTVGLRDEALPLAIETVDIADRLVDDTSASSEVAGMAHIAAATAAAASWRPDLVDVHIEAARGHGARVPRVGYTQGLVFSREIVHTWEVWSAAEQEDPDRILQVLRVVDLAALPAERCGSMWMEAARGLAGVRAQAARATRCLRVAEAVAPQRVRSHVLTRETIAALIAAARGSDDRDYLRGLAHRCGMSI